MRIVFTGGSTGGHFYPLIAIAEAMLAHAQAHHILSPEFYFMGPDEYDGGSLFSSGITFVKIPAGKMRRYFSLKNVTDVFKTIHGTFVALWKLYLIYPDVVMSKGGYTTVPIVCAAWFLRIPIVIHESDALPGRANKFAAPLATYIAISHESTAASFPQKKVALTGIPTRKEFLSPPTQDAVGDLGLTGERPLILVLGGSQGAERINNLIISALPDLLASYDVVHQTGAAHHAVVLETVRALIRDESLLAHYRTSDFFEAHTLHGLESAATLVISRAGSGSINEISLHGKASILIPIPEDISHDQRSNAYAHARIGAAVVMEEKNMTNHLLVSEINRIIGSPELLQSMEQSAQRFAKRDAAELIADTLLSIGLSHER